MKGVKNLVTACGLLLTSCIFYEDGSSHQEKLSDEEYEYARNFQLCRKTQTSDAGRQRVYEFGKRHARAILRRVDDDRNELADSEIKDGVWISFPDLDDAGVSLNVSWQQSQKGLTCEWELYGFVNIFDETNESLGKLYFGATFEWEIKDAYYSYDLHTGWKEETD